MRNFVKRFAVMLMTGIVVLGAMPITGASGATIEPTAQTISAGYYLSMFIASDGTLWGCGSNYRGQVGDGTKEDRSVPVKIMDNVVSVSAGYEHTMAITEDGSLWAWGSNLYGQLGDGSDMPQARPVKVMDNVAMVSAGDRRTMAVKTDGSLWAWGDNTDGDLGNGEYSLSGDMGSLIEPLPIKIMDDVKSVSTSSTHTLAVKTDGTLVAWGTNFYGELGNGFWGNEWDNHAGPFQTVPMKIMDDVAAVSTYGSTSMAIKTDGSLWAWGGDCDALGVATSGDATSVWGKPIQSNPIKVMDDVAAVDTGASQTMAIKTDGSLWAWGSNSMGKLGIGAAEDYETILPVKVMDNVSSVSTWSHTIAVKNDGSIWAWGENANGQLGNNHVGDLKSYLYETPYQNVPVKVSLNAKLPDPNGGATAADAVSDWAKEEIELARQAGLVTEHTQSYMTYACTRFQFAELIVNMTEKVTGKAIEAAPDTTFTDCKEEAVLKAYAAGIVSGVGDGQFAPDRTTNREQIATMIYRAITYIEQETGKTFTEKNTDLAGYTDQGSVSTWATEAVGVLANNGIMKGTSDTVLSPDNTCSVEQSILLVYRVFGLAE